jgi:hypothetical protein
VSRIPRKRVCSLSMRNSVQNLIEKKSRWLPY